MTFADHFSAVAARYAQYRPRYPQALVDALAARCPAHAVAWDAGCGNGQLSVALAARFERVIATDPAQAQLDQAEAHPRVEYRRATAEESGLAAGSVDLAVAAQAAHWFDWAGYVAEVGRVARPGALAAVLCYSWLRMAEPVHEVVARYYADLGPYWAPERRLVETGYRDLVWPWPTVEVPELELTASWTREELAGYIATWSATQQLVRRAGPARYDALCAELAAAWPDDERREVRWPLALRLARVTGPARGAAL